MSRGVRRLTAEEESQEVCEVCADVLPKGYVAFNFGGEHFHVVGTTFTAAMKKAGFAK